MIKRYCDKCGIEIINDYYFIEVKGKHHYKKTWSGYYDIPFKNLEVCEKCYNNLIDYLNKKDS